MAGPSIPPQGIASTIQKNSDVLSGIREELSKKTVIHIKVNQEIIVTTSDKLKLLLNDNKNAIGSEKDWLTPFSILISIVTTLCTCDFKTRYGLSKESWHAIFVLCATVSALWLVNSLNKLRKNWRKSNPETLIEKLKL